MRNYFETVITYIFNAFWRVALCHEIYFNILRTAKQMRKIIYNRALFILHKIRQTRTTS